MRSKGADSQQQNAANIGGVPTTATADAYQDGGGVTATSKADAKTGAGSGTAGSGTGSGTGSGPTDGKNVVAKAAVGVSAALTTTIPSTPGPSAGVTLDIKPIPSKPLATKDNLITPDFTAKQGFMLADAEAMKWNIDLTGAGLSKIKPTNSARVGAAKALALVKAAVGAGKKAGAKSAGAKAEGETKGASKPKGKKGEGKGASSSTAATSASIASSLLETVSFLETEVAVALGESQSLADSATPLYQAPKSILSPDNPGPPSPYFTSNPNTPQSATPVQNQQIDVELEPDVVPERKERVFSPTLFDADLLDMSGLPKNHPFCPITSLRYAVTK